MKGIFKIFPEATDIIQESFTDKIFQPLLLQAK